VDSKKGNLKGDENEAKFQYVKYLFGLKDIDFDSPENRPLSFEQFCEKNNFRIGAGYDAADKGTSGPKNG